jgi:hypothetical protein
MPVRIRRLVGPFVVALLALPAAALAQGACADRLPPERITLSLRDANVQTTLRLLAQQYRINMIVTDEVKGTITFDFYQVPARDIFQSVIDSAYLQCVEVAGVLRVSSFTRLREEDNARRDAAAKRGEQEATAAKKQVEAERERDDFEKVKARGAVREKTIRLSYANAEEVAKTIQGILGLPPEGAQPPQAPIPSAYLPPPPINIPSTPLPPPSSPFSPAVVSLPAEALAQGLTVRAYKPTNSVFIRYYANDLERIERLIKEQLDIPLPQVQIAATMVITTQNALEQIGVQWGGAVIGKTAEGRGPAVVAPGSPPLAAAPEAPAWWADPSRRTPTSPAPISCRCRPPRAAIGQNLVNLPTSFLPTISSPAMGVLFGLVGANYNVQPRHPGPRGAGQGPEDLGAQGRHGGERHRRDLPRLRGAVHEHPHRGCLERPVQGGRAAVAGHPQRDLRERGDQDPHEDPRGERRAGLSPGPSEAQAIRQSSSGIARPKSVVTEGEKLVIGGVTLDNSAKTTRGVPLLSKIPIVGWLFKSREVASGRRGARDRHHPLRDLRRQDGGEVAPCTRRSSASTTRRSSSRPTRGSCFARRATTRSSPPCLYGITSQKGLMALIGDVGHGKTTLCRALLRELPGEVQSALVLNPHLSDVELVGTILDDLGIERRGHHQGRADDHAQPASPRRGGGRQDGGGRARRGPADDRRALEQIRILSTLETATRKLLQIVLAGAAGAGGKAPAP